MIMRYISPDRERALMGLARSASDLGRRLVGGVMAYAFSDGVWSAESKTEETMVIITEEAKYELNGWKVRLRRGHSEMYPNLYWDYMIAKGELTRIYGSLLMDVEEETVREMVERMLEGKVQYDYANANKGV